MTLIYKLLERAAWDEALAAGVFTGSPVDLADGFIHFSAADQVSETARRHFAGRSDLVLLTVEAGDLGADLRWEPSRGGALFPHLYASLPTRLVRRSMSAPLGPDGVPRLGDLTP